MRNSLNDEIRRRAYLINLNESSSILLDKLAEDLGQMLNSHSTNTFEHYMNLANDYNLNVIKNMYTPDEDALDYDAAEKMIRAIYEGKNNISSDTEKNLSSTHISVTSTKKAVINIFN